jgi:hypothetical protein
VFGERIIPITWENSPAEMPQSAGDAQSPDVDDGALGDIPSEFIIIRSIATSSNVMGISGQA